MSVPKSKRSESKLEALVKLSDLYGYTLKICTDEKIIPKKYRWFGGRDLADGVQEAIKSAVYANNTRVTDTETALIRRYYQIMATNEMVTLGVLANEFYKVRRFKRKAFRRWRTLYYEAYGALYKWKAKDDDRYRKYRSDKELVKLLEDYVLPKDITRLIDLDFDPQTVKNKICPPPYESEIDEISITEKEPDSDCPIRFNAKGSSERKSDKKK